GVNNLEAIRKGVRGYEAGGAVGTTASILTGGRDKLAQIEENTFRTAEEAARMIGYLQTLVDDGQTMLSVMRGVQSSVDGLSITVASASRGSTGGTSGGSSGGTGGTSSGGTSGGIWGSS